jgi:hypothetical protein
MNKMKKGKDTIENNSFISSRHPSMYKTDKSEGYYHQFYVSPLIPIVVDEILLENLRFSWSLESIMINRTNTKLYILNDSIF